MTVYQLALALCQTQRLKVKDKVNYMKKATLLLCAAFLAPSIALAGHHQGGDNPPPPNPPQTPTHGKAEASGVCEIGSTGTPSIPACGPNGGPLIPIPPSFPSWLASSPCFFLTDAILASSSATPVTVNINLGSGQGGNAVTKLVVSSASSVHLDPGIPFPLTGSAGTFGIFESSAAAAVGSFLTVNGYFDVCPAS